MMDFDKNLLIENLEELASKEMQEKYWIKCDSQSDMDARISKLTGKFYEALISDEANSWGYLAIGDQKNFFVPIGFIEVGLTPKVYISGKIAVIGVSTMLGGYDVDTGKLKFKYKMPTVFHEFVRFDEDSFIIQDETGFVCLSFHGNEKWIRLFEDIIVKYNVVEKSISGETMEGGSFKFDIPY